MVQVWRREVSGRTRLVSLGNISWERVCDFTLQKFWKVKTLFFLAFELTSNQTKLHVGHMCSTQDYWSFTFCDTMCHLMRLTFVILWLFNIQLSLPNNISSAVRGISHSVALVTVHRSMGHRFRQTCFHRNFSLDRRTWNWLRPLFHNSSGGGLCVDQTSCWPFCALTARAQTSGPLLPLHGSQTWSSCFPVHSATLDIWKIPLFFFLKFTDLASFTYSKGLW